MSREEEITRQAKEHAKYAVDGDRSEISFQLGAVWADKHPNKRLIDIDDAIRWLKDNASKFAYTSVRTNEASIDENRLTEEFHDAMINKDDDNVWYVDSICDKCDKSKYCSQSNYMKENCDKRQ